MDISTDILCREVLSNDLLCLSPFSHSGENMLNIFSSISAKWISFILFVLPFEIYLDIKHSGTHLELNITRENRESRLKRYAAGLSNTNSR